MNKALFQKQYAAELKALIESKFGQSLLATIGSMRPAYEFPIQEHLLSENRGAMRGYELCLKNIISLSIPQIATPDVEQDYGVPNSPPQTNQPK